MTFQDFVNWTSHSWLGDAGRDLFWVFPTAEIFHFFGLCLLMGSMIFIDLRLLGFAKRIPIANVLAFVPAAMVGIVINTLSGIVFLCTYPENYWPSTAFRFKLLAIAIGIANALWFKYVEEPKVLALPEGSAIGARTRTFAFISIFIWTLVIVLGRLLPYVSKSTS